MSGGVTRGVPRQFWVMNEKRRCSILFHLLVPGGRWHTLIGRASSLASVCSSTFHSRNRYPLLPPPAAMINKEEAVGYKGRPISYHQVRIVSTANSAVS